MIVVAALVPILSGCIGPFASSSSPELPCNAEVVNFYGNIETLGSGTRFTEELGKAARDSDSVTLIEVTRAAGWTDGWERMVDVQPAMDPEDLSRAAQANVAPGCWKGIPAKQDSSTEVPWGYYLFFANNRPVQKIIWTGDKKPLRLNDRLALAPPSVLIRDPKGRLVPAP
ncbi:hypothetical protein OHB12_01395 [Nocardia sp. NBC_01730]|uniref:hypothetical protein n=1 Tax=Nocardia sp. NBC_01730 TaxID=2975998 RepID=UPI002E101C00|nr:hypothetical protein OHB12_01395 [Nocardia sp. NBC_01730]